VAAAVVIAQDHINQVALMVVKEEVVAVPLGVVLVELLVHKEMMVVMVFQQIREFMAVVEAAVPVVLVVRDQLLLVVLVVLVFRCQQPSEILHQV
jgi:hypothetical protein|tara:strand:+ start:158 stop:442 length:285 start_codon:yes stop_codon:yes gene_type:complete